MASLLGTMLRFCSLGLALLAGAASAQPVGGVRATELPAKNTLINAIAANSKLTMLAEGIARAPGLTEYLGDLEKNATVFAPSNAALASSDLWTNLPTPQWVAHLADLLLFYITVGSVLSTNLEDGMQLTMLNEEVLTTGIANGTVVLSSTRSTVESMVIQADKVASNGILHIVDSMLLPVWVNTSLLSLASSGRFSFFGEFLELSGAGALFTPFSVDTILAPTSVVTLLAPTDDAFGELGEETLAFYRNPNNTAALFDLLTNHMLVNTLYPSSGLVDALVIITLSGLELGVSISGDGVMFNDASVVEADILAIDGIVHAINTVLVTPRELPNTTKPTTASSVPPVPSVSIVQAASQAPTDDPTQRNNETFPPSNAPVVPPVAAPPSRVPKASSTTTAAPIPYSTTSQPITKESPSTIAPAPATNVPDVASTSQKPSAKVPTLSINAARGTSTGAFIGSIVGCLVFGAVAATCFLKRQQRRQQRRSEPDSVFVATSPNAGVVASPPAHIEFHRRVNNARMVLPDYKDQVSGYPAPLAQAVLVHGNVDAEVTHSILLDAEDSSSILWWPTSFPSQGARPANN